LVLDRDAWARVQEHERAQQEQFDAQREMDESESECRSLGVPVDVTSSQTETYEGSRRRGGRQIMGDI
jgi:hypothetical protein